MNGVNGVLTRSLPKTMSARAARGARPKLYGRDCGEQRSFRQGQLRCGCATSDVSPSILLETLENRLAASHSLSPTPPHTEGVRGSCQTLDEGGDRPHLGELTATPLASVGRIYSVSGKVCFVFSKGPEVDSEKMISAGNSFRTLGFCEKLNVNIS